MVATVRNLTSSSATAEYFRNEGGYYTGGDGETGGEEDPEEVRAKRAEHRRGNAWFGEGAAALGLEEGREVAAGAFEKVLQGRILGTDIRQGRLRDGKHEHRPGFDITFSAPKSVSLAALLPTEQRPRGDCAAIRAHDEAVTGMDSDFLDGAAGVRGGADEMTSIALHGAPRAAMGVFRICKLAGRCIGSRRSTISPASHLATSPAGNSTTHCSGIPFLAPSALHVDPWAWLAALIGMANPITGR